MKIWAVTEYILTEKDPAFGEEQNVGYYSSKHKAIKAVYSYLLNDFDPEDVTNRVKKEENDNYVIITTECGDDYGMYDCRYEIVPVTLDEKFGE